MISSPSEWHYFRYCRRVSPFLPERNTQYSPNVRQMISTDTDRYRVPQKGDRVILDAEPAAVGLHAVVDEEDELTVIRRRITAKDGLCVVVASPEAEPPVSYRLRWDHVRPLNGNQ
jgi:hypothetical protein